MIAVTKGVKNDSARILLPKLKVTLLPAIKAPIKTITPNKPGIKLFLMTLAPYAAENAGDVPLPPILIAKNIANKKGIVKTLKFEIILFLME